MGARSFLLAVTAGFVAICIGYFLAVDTFAVPDRSLPRSYKQFLLEAAGDQQQRILIDGGSNSIYGIDAATMETSLGRLTLVLGDNAHYPLAHKLYRLQSQLKPGDLVILPLEWFHYTWGDSMPEIYVESILDPMGSNGFYYHNLPLPQRLLFVFRHMPFQLALERVLYRNAEYAKNFDLRHDIRWSGMRFGMGIHASLRGDFDGLERDAREYAKQEASSCDRYLFGLDVDPSLELHPDFVANLGLMRDIEDRTGARFFLAWPSVAEFRSDECYQSAATEALSTLVARIQEAAENYGIEILGEPADGVYDKNCFWDSYYHLTRECARDHTGQLVAQLQASGVRPVDNYDRAAVDAALLAHLFRIRFPDLEQSHALNEPMVGSYLPDYMNFLQGWSTVNALGAWAGTEEVVIAIPLGDLPVAGLQLEGSYMLDPEPVEVIVNGQSMGRLSLDRQVIDLTGVDTSRGLLLVELKHPTLHRNPEAARQAYYRLYRVILLSEDKLPEGIEVEENTVAREQ